LYPLPKLEQGSVYIIVGCIARILLHFNFLLVFLLTTGHQSLATKLCTVYRVLSTL
jgi:hypothetical protein